MPEATNIACVVLLYCTNPPHVLPAGIAGFTVHCVFNTPLCEGVPAPNNWNVTIFTVVVGVVVSVPSIVMAALADTIPPVLLTFRLLNVVADVGTACANVPFSSTVPLLCVKVPLAAFAKFPATFSMVDGAVTDPLVMVKVAPTSAELDPNDHPPVALLKVRMLNLFAPVKSPEILLPDDDELKSTVPVPAVNVPLFVNPLPSVSVWEPQDKVLLAGIVKLATTVVAALSVIVSAVLFNARVLNVVAFAGIVWAVVPFSSTVPPLWVKVPAVRVKFPAIFNVDEGAVTPPAPPVLVIVKFPPTSAAFAPNDHEPDPPLKVRLLNLLVPVITPLSVLPVAAALKLTNPVPASNVPLLVQLPATFIVLAPAHINVALASFVKLFAIVVVMTEGLVATVTDPVVLLFLKL